MSRRKNQRSRERPVIEDTIYDIVARKAFPSIGIDYDNGVRGNLDDKATAMLDSLGRAFVDITLDEILGVFSEE